MGIGAGVFLIAVGAVLRWAITAHVNGLNLPVIGDILMIVGIAGVVLSLLFWSTASIGRRRGPYDGPYV